MMDTLKREVPFFWQAPEKEGLLSPFTMNDLEKARAFMESFRPFLLEVFPETKATEGRIISELRALPQMEKVLEIPKGKLYAKFDNMLPVAGSIKARGGFYEVLHHARSLAEKAGFYEEDPLNILRHRDFFSLKEIEVASTGNLGLSIGIISATIGFKVTVHMSRDAKEWKKELLRQKGARVIEYAGDYSSAVESAREASKEKGSYFVDDEKSPYLFMGYALAAYEVQAQLKELGIEKEQLHVYLPCGVGGAPGGICYGLSLLLPEAEVYFAEPTKAPAVLLGMATGKHDGISVGDIGLSGKTIADGLAVGKASSLVGPLMEGRIKGIYTIEDETMLSYVKMLYEAEHIKVEPSACAGFSGPQFVQEEGVHLAWLTGGRLVPEDIFQSYLKEDS